LIAVPRITPGCGRHRSAPGQGLERENCDPYRAHVAVGALVERLAAAVGAIIRVLENATVISGREDQVDAGRERDPALPAAQAVARVVYRDQRRRARVSSDMHGPENPRCSDPPAATLVALPVPR